jgi:hypothetical protein
MFDLLQLNWPLAIAPILVFVAAGTVHSELNRRRAGAPPVERLEKLKRKQLDPLPQAKAALPLRVEKHDPISDRNDDPTEPAQIASGLLLQPGTRVQAVRNVGSVKEGMPGIVTGAEKSTSFWRSRPAYQCTFADNTKCVVCPEQIEVCEHRYTLRELEQPNFASVVSGQITFRAQQIFSDRKRLKTLQ